MTVLAVALAASCGGTSGTPGDAPGDELGAGSDGPSLGCPSVFTHVPGGSEHLYRFLAPADWDTQVTACAAFGLNVYLAIPDDAAELSGTIALATADFWAGISDIVTENSFVTVKNAPATFLPWASGEPNNLNGNQDCVRVRQQLSLIVDDNCASALPAVCECDP